MDVEIIEDPVTVQKRERNPSGDTSSQNPLKKVKIDDDESKENNENIPKVINLSAQDDESLALILEPTQNGFENGNERKAESPPLLTLEDTDVSREASNLMSESPSKSSKSVSQQVMQEYSQEFHKLASQTSQESSSHKPETSDQSSEKSSQKSTSPSSSLSIQILDCEVVIDEPCKTPKNTINMSLMSEDGGSDMAKGTPGVSAKKKRRLTDDEKRIRQEAMEKKAHERAEKEAQRLAAKKAKEEEAEKKRIERERLQKEREEAKKKAEDLKRQQEEERLRKKKEKEEQQRILDEQKAQKRKELEDQKRKREEEAEKKREENEKKREEREKKLREEEEKKEQKRKEEESKSYPVEIHTETMTQKRPNEKTDEISGQNEHKRPKRASTEMAERLKEEQRRLKEDELIRKQEERQRKEVEKEELRRKREEERLRKEEERRRKEAEKEEQRIRREEEKARLEEEKRRKEAEREEERRRRDAEKEEQRRKKEEEKARREEERRRKEAEKEEERRKREEDKERKRREAEELVEQHRREQEAKEAVKRRMSESLLKFIKKKESKPEVAAPAQPSPVFFENAIFKPFPLKQGMRMAPILVREPLTADVYDKMMTIQIEKNEYLESLPKRQKVKPNPLKAKLFQFHDNYRPPYYGTWRKKSKFISPRRPFSEDDENINYEYDSDEEWQNEPSDAEECLSTMSDEEEMEPDEDDGFFVPHGYISEDEGSVDEVGAKEDPEARQRRLAELDEEFRESRQNKAKRAKVGELKVRLYGPYFGPPDPSEVPEDIIEKHFVPAILFHYPDDDRLQN